MFFLCIFPGKVSENSELFPSHKAQMKLSKPRRKTFVSSQLVMINVPEQRLSIDTKTKGKCLISENDKKNIKNFISYMSRSRKKGHFLSVFPPIICKFPWENSALFKTKEIFIHVKIASTAESTSMCVQLTSAAVYWLNEFNLLQFLLLPVFILITFGKKFSLYFMPLLLPFESNQYVFQLCHETRTSVCVFTFNSVRNVIQFYWQFKNQTTKTSRSRYDINFHSILSWCIYSFTRLVCMSYKSFCSGKLVILGRQKDDLLVNWFTLIAFEAEFLSLHKAR